MLSFLADHRPDLHDQFVAACVDSAETLWGELLSRAQSAELQRMREHVAMAAHQVPVDVIADALLDGSSLEEKAAEYLSLTTQPRGPRT